MELDVSLTEVIVFKEHRLLNSLSETWPADAEQLQPGS
jgi:hypothetical protein